MIKLKCSNNYCNYYYQVSEKEMLDNAHYHQKCIICHSKLIVDNVEELLAQDIEQQAEENLQQYLHEYGIEGTVELIERSPINGVRDLYMRKLRERGIIK